MAKCSSRSSTSLWPELTRSRSFCLRPPVVMVPNLVRVFVSHISPACWQMSSTYSSQCLLLLIARPVGTVSRTGGFGVRGWVAVCVVRGPEVRVWETSWIFSNAR